MIVVLSVMTGFSTELRRKVLGFEAHLTISTQYGTIRDWEAAQQQLDKIPGIVASSPYVMGPALLEFEANFTSAKIRGIDPESEQKIADLAKYTKVGKFDLDGDKCLVGIELANILHLRIGDKILLHGPKNLQGVMEELKKTEAKDPNAKSITEIRQLISRWNSRSRVYSKLAGINTTRSSSCCRCTSRRFFTDSRVKSMASRSGPRIRNGRMRTRR
jgi:lipoprotein-releasing system permease protein